MNIGYPEPSTPQSRFVTTDADSEAIDEEYLAAAPEAQESGPPEVLDSEEGDRAGHLSITDVKGVGPRIAEQLSGVGIYTVMDLLATDIETLCDCLAVSQERADRLLLSASQLLEGDIQ